MIDSISIAQTGLQGFQDGLRTIANNTANLNTPGFKGASTQFADMFYGGSSSGGSWRFGQCGYGVNTLGTSLNFKQGQLQSTDNALDLAIDGKGFFTLRDSSGNIHYSKDGQFKFNSDGVLISSTTGEEVLALDGGALTNISLTNLRTNPAKATSTITFTGNLSSSATTNTISNVTVIDSAGSSHSLSLVFTPVSGSSNTWTVALMDGTTSVGSGTIAFSGGQPVSGSNSVAVTYTPTGGTAVALTLDFSSNVTSYDSGSSSSLAVASQNGYSAGTLTKETFDGTGTLVLTYSNGQTVKSKQLALGQFRSEDDVESVGNNEFGVKNGHAWQVGVASTGEFGAIQSGEVEMSNVDLSKEFSSLVIMQRGYQACSQVVSTASEMLTSLYGMSKG